MLVIRHQSLALFFAITLQRLEGLRFNEEHNPGFIPGGGRNVWLAEHHSAPAKSKGHHRRQRAAAPPPGSSGQAPSPGAKAEVGLQDQASALQLQALPRRANQSAPIGDLQAFLASLSGSLQRHAGEVKRRAAAVGLHEYNQTSLDSPVASSLEVLQASLQQSTEAIAQSADMPMTFRADHVCPALESLLVALHNASERLPAADQAQTWLLPDERAVAKALGLKAPGKGFYLAQVGEALRSFGNRKLGCRLAKTGAAPLELVRHQAKSKGGQAPAGSAMMPKKELTALWIIVGVIGVLMLIGSWVCLKMPLAALVAPFYVLFLFFRKIVSLVCDFFCFVFDVLTWPVRKVASCCLPSKFGGAKEEDSSDAEKVKLEGGYPPCDNSLREPVLPPGPMSPGGKLPSIPEEKDSDYCSSEASEIRDQKSWEWFKKMGIDPMKLDPVALARADNERKAKAAGMYKRK